MKFLIVTGILLVIVSAFLSKTYKSADVDRALIVTGGRTPIVRIAGGSFVIPFFRKAKYFDLSMITINSDKKEINTIIDVPIIADWSARLRPDTSDIKTLKKAIVEFSECGHQVMVQDANKIMIDAVRKTVRTMTPEEVLRNGKMFANTVNDMANKKLKKIGLELVSLNLLKVYDNNHYYENLAAFDMEEKKKAAEAMNDSIDQNIYVFEKEPEWACPYCMNINKESEMNCHGCGAPKPRTRSQHSMKNVKKVTSYLSKNEKDSVSTMIESLFA